MPTFSPSLLSRHAVKEARRERIPIEMIAAAYEDPDAVRVSDHDADREIRSRWRQAEGIEVVVDRVDGRVVTVWRRGWRP